MANNINVTLEDAQPINVILESGICSIPTSLGDLADVVLTTPLINNESLVYDLVTNKWVNRKMLYFDLDYECFMVVD